MKIMNKEKPLLICMTSTRNYAWCTRAFLEANSTWADYIIIVDQMSTDGTREMIKEYPKAIIVDNPELSYSETKRCELALDCARSIEGDKILIYLAIDEVLSANWRTSDDWNTILHSKQGSVFYLRWANIMPDGKTYNKSNEDMFRVFHDDGITPFDNQGKDMHTHCLPYPNNGTDLNLYDIVVLHFANYNVVWNYVKRLYYQMVDYDKTGRSLISLDRYYSRALTKYEDFKFPKGECVLPSKWLYPEFDVVSLVDNSSRPTLCDNMLELINKNGIDRYRHLNIWTPRICEYLSVKDPRSWSDKMIHFYLDKTYKHRNRKIVRVLDKLISLFI